MVYRRQGYFLITIIYKFFSQLDVKEAPEVPTEHPQWDLSEEEEDSHRGGMGEASDVSEFTTDEDVED